MIRIIDRPDITSDVYSGRLARIKQTIYIPDKIRNETHRTDQLSGRSQVMGQFRLYRCKDMSGTAALYIVCNQASKNVYKKIGQKPSRGQIVKSQKFSVFIMLSCWISPGNGNLLSRPNGTQTLFLCKFYPEYHHTRLLNAR